MATKEKNTAETEQKADMKVPVMQETPAAKVETALNGSSFYTAEELSAGAKNLFNVRSECVAAALRAAGITKCTVSKAKEVVAEFMKKEVK